MVAIQHIATRGQAATALTTMPTHQKFDLLLFKALRTSATPASLPAGYTGLFTLVQGTFSYRVGAKIALSAAEASPTWTNAVVVICSTYRGALMPTKWSTGTAASGTTITFPALTKTGAGASWFHRDCYNNAATNVSTSTLTGYTPRTGTGASVGSGAVYNLAQQRSYDSNGPLQQATADAMTVNASGPWLALTIELPSATSTNINREPVFRAALH
jgi:hypothetical protein